MFLNPAFAENETFIGLHPSYRDFAHENFTVNLTLHRKIMKKIISLMVFFLGTLVANSQTSSIVKTFEKDTFKTADLRNEALKNKRQINQMITGKLFYVKDSALYSSSFIQDLRRICPSMDSLKLLDDTLYVADKYTIGKKPFSSFTAEPLPTELPINKVVIYKAEKEQRKYLLKLKRVSYTGIEFELFLDDQSIRKGLAIMSGDFFLGSECGPDENGKEYCATQYLTKEKSAISDCYVRLTVEEKSGKRVSFRVDCTEGSGSIVNIPILIRDNQ